MPDNEKAVNIRRMPADLWWNVRRRAADERISAQALTIKALAQYLARVKKEE